MPSNRHRRERPIFESPRLDRSFYFHKRHLSPSVSPKASRKQKAARKKYTHRDGGVCSTCVRCRSTSVKCDGEHPCSRFVWKKSDYVYKERSTEKCLTCREKGQKCDKEFPCARCASQGAQCTYADEPSDAKRSMGAVKVRTQEEQEQRFRLTS
jgi:hypothetical protein